MNRKIILDCDPGIDDAVAIAMALFDPRIDVLAITATAGTIDSEMATHNVAALVAALDPPRHPRLGAASPTTGAPVVDDGDLHGSDGLGEIHLPASPRQHPKPSEKVIGELAVQHPGEITLVCLGPLTNLSRLSRFDPAAIEALDRVVISGGSLAAAGNASPVAERNMFFDPLSADVAFQTAITKQLVPLDVTDEVTFGVQLIEQLPDRHSRAGRLLHQILPFAFRSSRQILGRELIPLYDPVALVATLDPDLFSWEPVAGRVETAGELTRGMTVFDRRLRSQWPENMEIAVACDADEVRSSILRSLLYAGQHS